MSRILAVILVSLASDILVTAQETDQIVTGTRHQIHSNVLNEDRSYWVSLPEDYHQESTSYKRYPLMIVLDGDAFIRPITGVVNYMSTGARIPEMIVIAIQNVNRRRDYTPDKIVTTRPNDFGGGDNFLRFLEEELIPELEKEYRTAPYRILFGHSLGGLLATHAYMKPNTLFNSFIAVDPSFGTWDETKMDNKLATVTEKTYERFIYIASANWGKRNIRNRDRHIRLYESLNSISPGEFRAKLEYFENENHSSVPVIAFHNGINAIFEGYGISYRDVDNKGQLIEHFTTLSERLSYKFPPPEALVNRIAYNMLRSDPSKALEFFELNAENYPDSYNVFDSLGEAYERLGDTDKAIQNFEKSLSLYPLNNNAKSSINRLKSK